MGIVMLNISEKSIKMSQDKSTYGRHQQGLDILCLGFVFLTQVTEKMLVPEKKKKKKDRSLHMS